MRLVVPLNLPKKGKSITDLQKKKAIAMIIYPVHIWIRFMSRRRIGTEGE